MNIKFFLILCFGILVSCKTTTKQVETADEPKDFELPVVPPVIADTRESYVFIATDYWENFIFSDSTAYKQSTEQIFVNFLNILPHLNLSEILQSMAIMMQYAEVDSAGYIRLTNICEKYLYGVNSPYRSDELYIPVLQSIIKTKWIDEQHKAIPEYRLKMAQKNRIGNQAADFVYTLESGKSNKMSNIKTEFTLLFINNPDCHACTEYAERIQSSSVIQQMIAEKKLTVLAIYPDEDLTEWKKHQQKIPVNWINAYDSKLEIKKNEIYDLRAIPTLYLLDKNKNVLLKDTFAESVDRYLNAVLANNS